MVLLYENVSHPLPTATNPPSHTRTIYPFSIHPPTPLIHSPHTSRPKERLVEYNQLLRELLVCAEKEFLHGVSTVKVGQDTSQLILTSCFVMANEDSYINTAIICFHMSLT